MSAASASDWRPTQATSTSTYLVDELYDGRWVTIGIYVHTSLRAARETLAYYRAKRGGSMTYRIVEEVTVRQPPTVVEFSEPDVAAVTS